jgi:hypothetical protein
VRDGFERAVRAVPGARGAVRRFRRAILARDLRRLHDALATTGLAGRYAVTGGMLLGWARGRRLMLDDGRDADFVFDAADTEAFTAAVSALVASGFVPTQRFRNNNGDPVEYRFLRHGAQFDFFAVSTIDGRARYFMFDGGDELVCERIDQPTTPFDFLGRQWLKPRDHERALTDNYGDWRARTPSWNFTEARTVVARHPARFGSEPWDGTDSGGTTRR